MTAILDQLEAYYAELAEGPKDARTEELLRLIAGCELLVAQAHAPDDDATILFTEEDVA